ncbi:MAG: proprionate catabolism activator, Fis family [Clostridiales bacterium]|nr:proprionate catabolism activator, Fis family [Clostridiales bacterium]
MAKIAFLLPREDMVEQAKKVVKDEDADVEIKVVTSQNVLEEANLSMLNGADVLIARGNHAAILSKNITIPLVEIVLSGQEIAKLIYEAKVVLRKQKSVIGIIGFKNMFSEIKPFAEILDVTLREYLVNSTEDLELSVQEAAEDKVDLIIGGDISNRVAEELGIPTLFLKSGEESIREAYRIAEKISYASDMEKKNTAEFKTILNYSFDAIIKLNNKGIIVILNYLAEKILKKPSNYVIGKHITEVFNLLDEKLIESVLKDGKGINSTLIQKGNLALVANIAPIEVDNKIEGVILSFQEFKKIEEMEAEIRKETYSKGYIAQNTFEQIIGESPESTELKSLAKIYAKYDAPIMITGEFGTGKKLFVESIHNESLRRNNPFVVVDCASMPPDLLEKKLYGYMDDGHLRSQSPVKKGLFEIAHSGTIFFNNITELNMYEQLRLLKVMREGSIVRIGDDRALRVNVLVICSVNKNIINLIKEGKFSEDLYYMLNVLSINIPPLRKRKKDIETLLNYFIEQYSYMYRKHVILTDAAREVVYSYPWPGNVQQLRKFCEKLIILSIQKVLDEGFINKCFEDYSSCFHENKFDITDNNGKKVVVYKSPEAARILELLNIYKGNRSKVAEELNISTTTLWRKIKKYDIENAFNF